MISKMLVSTPRKKVYTCDVCNNVFHWNEGKSYWYGNFLTPENNIYMCSLECKLKYQNETQNTKQD